jgi:hypothetical protein
MTAAEIFHYLHVVVFAVIVGIEVPAFYALKLALNKGAETSARALGLKVKRMTDALSGSMMILMLPLGVHIATEIGVYTLMSDSWLYATWIVGLVWFAIALLAEITGRSTLARRLYTTEIVLRIVIGLGNVYDAIVGFMGTGMIQTNWLATKILLFGLILMVSGWVRWQTRALRFADFSSGTDAGVSDASLKRAQWGTGLIVAMVLVAAWMGTLKTW